jgi:hypothetical protein
MLAHLFLHSPLCHNLVFGGCRRGRSRRRCSPRVVLIDAAGGGGGGGGSLCHGAPLHPKSSSLRFVRGVERNFGFGFGFCFCFCFCFWVGGRLGGFSSLVCGRGRGESSLLALVEPGECKEKQSKCKAMFGAVWVVPAIHFIPAHSASSAQISVLRAERDVLGQYLLGYMSGQRRLQKK